MALIGSMPIFLLAAEKEQRGERAESFPRFSQEQQTTRLQNRSELSPEQGGKSLMARRPEGAN